MLFCVSVVRLEVMLLGLKSRLFMMIMSDCEWMVLVYVDSVVVMLLLFLGVVLLSCLISWSILLWFDVLVLMWLGKFLRSENWKLLFFLVVR